VDGLVAGDDPRLDAVPDMPHRPVVLGAYAAPADGDTP